MYIINIDLLNCNDPWHLSIVPNHKAINEKITSHMINLMDQGSLHLLDYSIWYEENHGITFLDLDKLKRLQTRPETTAIFIYSYYTYIAMRVCYYQCHVPNMWSYCVYHVITMTSMSSQIGVALVTTMNRKTI